LRGSIGCDEELDLRVRCKDFVDELLDFIGLLSSPFFTGMVFYEEEALGKVVGDSVEFGFESGTGKGRGQVVFEFIESGLSLNDSSASRDEIVPRLKGDNSGVDPNCF
jgi:hypothetical protein